MHVWTLIVAVLIGVVARAQTPAAKPAQGTTPALLVLPVPGAALSAESVEERTTKLPDGTSKTVVLRSKVYRDSSGRMRIEMSLDETGGEPGLFIQIVDRVSGFMAILLPLEKTAARVQFPKQDPSARVGLAIFGGPLIRVPGKKTLKSESLGKQIIDGIEYDGTRTTTTVDDQPSMIGVEERWTSRESGLIGLVKSSGPDEQITAKIHNVDRHAPDPTQFQIPADYFIRDMNPGDPAQ